MYRTPENSNRVQSIKSKFENIESRNSNDVKKSGTRSDLIITRNKTEIIKVDIPKQNLSRQLSDPAKRNIKRTPAFRFDKNADKNNQFQRSFPYNRSYKMEQFNSALKSNCDSNRNISRTENLYKDKSNAIKGVPEMTTECYIKPLLIKSKSSHDFAYIRSKFDQKNNENQKKNYEVNENQRENNNINLTSADTTATLYTEPIPKPLRNKVICSSHSECSNTDTIEVMFNKIYSANTLKIGDCETIKSITEDAHRHVKLDITDTLKAALKRPLPKGPAPQKPPRTFEHTFIKHFSNLPRNASFLHHQDHENHLNEKRSAKHDPRYMLNKLENALRYNKIRNRKQLKMEVATTSGEDSDDSVLFESKSKSEPPTIPVPSTNSQNSFNLNCLHGLTICKTTYETIKEPNSSFFVSCNQEEPVYSEPFSFAEHKTQKEGAMKNEKNGRKSLYYMSTSLLSNEGKISRENMDENLNQQDNTKHFRNQKETSQKQISPENSSLSSFTSDLDSATSTPLDEHNGFESSLKIKQLINTFENKQISPTKKKIQFRTPDSSHRIEDLKMTLQRTLEKCFDHDSKDSSDELEQKERKISIDAIINKFQTYVKTMPKYQKPKLHKEDRLFYCCLVVGWDTEKPQIKFKFPTSVKIPNKIEDLCYPEAASGPLDVSNNAQCYSLVITNDKGERTFGYCRRVIPEGSTKCIPLVYCILSKFRAPRFYKKILKELESRHGIPNKRRDELISEFYYNKFPRPGESIKINLTNVGDLNAFKNWTNQETYQPNSPENRDLPNLTSVFHVNEAGGYGTINSKIKTSSKHDYENVIINDSEDKNCSIVEKNGVTEMILTLHHDSRYEEADLKPLHRLPSDTLLKIFASLLLERKVILISCVISKLSCCVDALQSILYPFSWPHTFIPILPQCLWDVVESPTPVICGILSVSVVNQHKIEHGIVVDLDERNIIIEEGDENSILSDSMKKAWNQGLALANTVPPEDYVHSVYLSDAYIKVFIASLKHYKHHIVNGSFEKESFIRGGKTKGIRRFLKWFTETTMFYSFIDAVLSNSESFTLFDKKIEMYGSDESNMIVTKLLEWKK